MKWKIKINSNVDNKVSIVYTEQETRDDAVTFFKENYSRFNELICIEIAGTKATIIEEILKDMALYRTRKEVEREYGGFLRGLPKPELEKILETRLESTKRIKDNK